VLLLVFEKKNHGQIKINATNFSEL
jgi:hypothetical protein